MTALPITTDDLVRVAIEDAVLDGNYVWLKLRQPIGTEIPRPSTPPVASRPILPQITSAERRVLIELCRPLLLHADGFAVTPGNQEIARSLYLSVACVKTHIRSLFTKFAVGDLPQNHKRAELARRALDLGCVSAGDEGFQP